MCQGALSRLCNLSETCHVRKVARLLAQALSRDPTIEFASNLDREIVVVGRKQAVYVRIGNESAGTTQILSP